MKTSKQQLASYAISYANWLQGQQDRLAGLGCLSANGTYLEGWYNQNATCPEFLTPQLAAYIRQQFPTIMKEQTK